MFEDYLEDSRYFIDQGDSSSDEKTRKRCYRAAVFSGAAAVEAFVNFVGATLQEGGKFPPYEIAFLTDQAFGIDTGEFKILSRSDYHRLEDKVRFLIQKFSPGFDFSQEPVWSQFLQFKEFRDSITHPRQVDDSHSLVEYRKKAKTGLSSVVALTALLCKAVFDKPLRQRLLDLAN